ncbi:beta-1,3-galactosyltransferase 1-like isoform X1 [Haliotis asinina]|uniref:beta-1,3-galactosyltransferase 1-like isoform X1 n=1 Tax=Haliotis asinina TaxID=109174 RepID=UPI003531D4A4
MAYIQSSTLSVVCIHVMSRMVRWTPRQVLGTLGLTLFMTWFLLAITVKNTTPVTTFHPETPRRDILDFFVIQRNQYFNLHQYSFSINSHQCESDDPEVLIIVHSKPDFFQKRMVIRETFGSENRVDGTSISVVFMLGRVTNHTLQVQLEQEAFSYGDMIQGNFIDHYKNMTHKHVMAMHWVGERCNNIKTIVKIDDDVIVNPFNLVYYLKRTTKHHNTIHGIVLNSEQPFRNPHAKYYIPYAQYPFDILPEYCPGFAYITTPDVYRKLYEVSRDIRYLNMDDVYVTGVLALKAGVNKVNIDKVIFDCGRSKRNLSSLSSYIFVLNEDGACKLDPHVLWSDVKEK